MYFAQLILPLRLEWEPWYSSGKELVRGMRVRVRFSGREYIAVVHRCASEPDHYLDRGHILPIEGPAEGMAPISENELTLWEFISSYYLCSIGEVYKAACPGMKSSGGQGTHRQMERLKKRIAALDAEILRRNASPRTKLEITQRMIALRDGLARSFESLESFGSIGRLAGEVPEGMGDTGEETGNTDERAGNTDERAGNVSGSPGSSRSVKVSGRPLLLVGTDRTEVYADAIRNCNGDCLVLTPDRVSAVRMEKMLSSFFSCVIRAEAGAGIAKRRNLAGKLRHPAEKTVVVANRSGIFLPFSNLGLVIVDEEQDTFYKQEDPAPRYNGRDCAVKLASIHGALLILGSASPSLDSIFNVLCGKYERRETGTGQSVSGATEVIDIPAESRKNGMSGLFSRKLIDAINNYSGPVVLIRGWENAEELSNQCSLCLNREVSVMRYTEARDADLSSSMVGVIQADALVRKDDFRADEKAAQIVSSLSARCRCLIIQTCSPGRFSSPGSVDEMLAERREFGFPPFTRMVETRTRDGKVAEVFFLRKDSSLSAEKKIIASESAGKIIDVDPL